MKREKGSWAGCCDDPARDRSFLCAITNRSPPPRLYKRENRGERGLVTQQGPKELTGRAGFESVSWTIVLMTILTYLSRLSTKQLL